MALPGDDQSEWMETQHNVITTKRFTGRLPSLVVIASLGTQFNAATAIVSEKKANRYTDPESANVDELPAEYREPNLMPTIMTTHRFKSVNHFCNCVIER